MKCKCGSGKESSAHHYAGIFIGNDCPKCWQENDDARYYKLFPHLKKKKKQWFRKNVSHVDLEGE